MTLQHPMRSRTRPTRGEPAWEVAHLYPSQGSWSVERYLDLDTNHLVEFNDGVIEFLPMPTEFHQCLMLFLYDALKLFISKHGLGTVLIAPMKVRISDRLYREPDVVFMSNDNSSRRKNRFWDAADLVIEVVSDEGRKRDFEEKRRDYAEARIPEYWIVDPKKRQVVVLTLKGDQYIERGTYGAGRKASSLLLKGFSVDVAKLFKAADATRKSGGADR